MKSAVLRRSGWCVLLSVLLAPCFIAIASCSQDRPIDEVTARVLARAYALDNPLATKEMEAFVSANQSFFVANGSAIQAMRLLGGKLTQAGINAFDPQALARASQVGGPPEMVGQVARKLNSGATDIFCMGQELAWLAEVLPYAVQGDWRPYLQTRPICRGLTHIEAITRLEQLRKLADMSGNSDIVRQSLLAVEAAMPLTEQEMFLAAIMYGR